MANGNWNFKDLRVWLIVIGAAITCIISYTTLRATVNNIDKQAHKEHADIRTHIDKKVNKDLHNQCMQELKNNIAEMKSMQIRMEQKIDKILVGE